MSYATVQQLEDRLTAAVLNKRIVEEGDERKRVLDAYLDAASSVVDAWLSARYLLPAPQSPVLTMATLNIALWQIEADRGAAAYAAGQQLPANVQVPYDQAMKLLERLAKGDIALVGDDGAPAPTPGEAKAGLQVSAPPPALGYGSPGMEAF